MVYWAGILSTLFNSITLVAHGLSLPNIDPPLIVLSSMVKHKRKGPKGTEKESKKPKITSAEETQQASDAGPGKEAASSKVSDSCGTATHGRAWCLLEQLGDRNLAAVWVPVFTTDCDGPT